MLWANAGMMLMIAPMLLAIWAADRRLSPMGIWAAAMVLQAGAAVIFALRDSMPEAWAILGGNGLALLCAGLQCSVVRATAGHPPSPRLVLPAALWLLACSLPAFYGSLAARIVLFSCLVAACDVATVRAFLRLPASLRPVPQFGIALFGLRGLIHALRAATLLLDPPAAIGIPPAGPRWLTELLAYHMLLAYPAAGSLVILALVKGQAEQALGRAEQQRTLLIQELNHRVKNILATVQAMTLQTARRSDGDLARFTRDYGARLNALARAHDLLNARAWTCVPTREAVEAALAPWLASGQIDILGQPVATLMPAAGQTLVLALHELATNATKYGALSRPEGRVLVTLWRNEQADGAAELRLSWLESHGPPILAPPTRQGFGRRLLEQGLARQSGASVALDFRPTGLCCNIRLPLDRQAAGKGGLPEPLLSSGSCH